MLLLGIDFETTGLDIQTSKIIEIGAVLWDTETQTPVKIFSTLVDWPDLLEITQEITDITTITFEQVKKYGMLHLSAFDRFLDLHDEADYIVAHNGNNFDNPMLRANTRALNIDYKEKSWIDTTTDIEYPAHIRTRNLVTLAAEHGFLNPFPHRAVTDVMTMMRILSKYDIDKIITRAKSPMIRIKANVSYEEKDKAKDIGFRWDRENKKWYRDIKEMDLPLVSRDFNFKWERIFVGPN
jgi:DNA polymerase-3 subunit epsilon